MSSEEAEARRGEDEAAPEAPGAGRSRSPPEPN